MSNDRDIILSRVRSALAPLSDRARLPDWDLELAEAKKLVGAEDPETVFTRRIAGVNGRAFTDAAICLGALLQGGWKRGYCDPTLWPLLSRHLPEGLEVSLDFDRARVDDYDFGITRAVGAVAETGSLIIDDASTSHRLAALAPWVHIAVVSRKNIHTFLADALSELGDDPNVILVTGPSKTADVEGILIEGVHGPGQQWALICD